MDKYIPSKYTLFALASAFFAGCILTSTKIVSIYILPPVFILACLMLFMNRQKKSNLIIPILIIVFILGAYEYHLLSSRQSSFEQFEGKTITIEGVVGSELTPTEYGFKLLLKKVYYIHNDKIYKSHEKVQVYINKNENLAFGDQVRIKAEVEPIAKPRNFGDFDFEGYYKSKSIYVKAYAKEVLKLAENKGGFIPSLLYNSNQKVKNTIFSAMPETEAALLYGMLTGSKSEIDEEVMQVFSLTGLAHILSVSGLHIGFLVLMVNFILKPFKLSKKLHSIVTLAIVSFYILLIGAPVPAVRALLMLAVMLGGSAVGRKYDLNASASFAALLLLVYNPLLIHDPSFIISFACIYSIGFFYQPVNKFLSFVPSWIRSNMALSIAVFIGITPVLIYYFNYVSIINVLLNILAVPIAFLITLAGFGAVIIGIVLPPASAFVFGASYYLIKLLYFISEKSLLLPYTGFNVPSLSWPVNILYYAAALTMVEDFWKYKSLHFKRRYVAAGAVILFMIVLISLLPGNSMKLYFIDVGQGDCSVIKTPENKIIVVDGGGSPGWQKSSYDIGKKLTVPALLHLGIWKVDTVIVSHIHDDHLEGVLSILESYRVRQVMLPESDRYGQGEFSTENFEKLLKLCKEKNIPIIYLRKGSTISAGKNVELRVLAPSKPYIKNTDSDVNNNSLVFKLVYKDFDAIFTGDIQQEAEQRLLDEELQCDVLKVAHHGSPYSSTEGFIKKADPEISIISVGKNNYGHPAKEVIERLEENKSKVYRTDISGAVMLSTDGKSLKIRTVR